MNTTTAARTVLATLALAAGTLTVAAAPATAAAPPHSGRCDSVSHGVFSSWVGITTSFVDCSVAHDLGKRWSVHCRLASSTVTPAHCEVPVFVGSDLLAFRCSNTKAAQSPDRYHVRCSHRHMSVAFTYAYGS